MSVPLFSLGQAGKRLEKLGQMGTTSENLGTYLSFFFPYLSRNMSCYKGTDTTVN